MKDTNYFPLYIVKYQMQYLYKLLKEVDRF
jgi:hypothetical protein